MLRIYIADLAKYNSGELHGRWITLPNDNLWNEVREMLGSNEEWAIHDYEAPFTINEYEDLDQLNTLAEQYQDLDETEIKKVNYLINYQGETMAKALEHQEDVHIYEQMSYKDLAYDQVDEGLFGEVPDHLANYLDYDAIARDLECDYVEISNDLYYSQY